jgi:hypothetical protein
MSFQLVLSTTRWYIIGCYIPLNNLTTLAHIKQVWHACPRGCLPILLGDLNIILAACRPERQTRCDDRRAGGCHGAVRPVQPFLSTVWEKIPRSMNDCPAAEGRRRFLRDRPTQPMLESSGEKHGVPPCRLAAIEFYPCLHGGGLPKRGTGTATIEAKLAQKLAWMEQEPLYQVFVDLRKAYDHLDQERCLAIMTGYRVGPKLLRLQTKFWDQAEMVCHAGGGSFGKPFHAFRGVTQGGPLSSLMFNVICVDAVIREWLRLTLSEETARGRLWHFSLTTGLSDLFLVLMQ